MACETPLNRNGAGTSPVREVARSAAGVWHHALMLAELQGRLFLVEIGESLSRLQGAGLVVLAGCILGLATAPILLVTLALALIELTAMSPAGAFALVSLLALLVSASMVVVGSRRLRGAVTVPRSSLECELNWNWLKTTLREESAAASKPQSSSKR